MFLLYGGSRRKRLCVCPYAEIKVLCRDACCIRADGCRICILWEELSLMPNGENYIAYT